MRVLVLRSAVHARFAVASAVTLVVTVSILAAVIVVLLLLLLLLLLLSSHIVESGSTRPISTTGVTVAHGTV